MSASAGPVGYVVKTSDGVVATSGRATVLYGVCIVDDGTASTVNFYDGTSTAGTLVLVLKTTAGVPLAVELAGDHGVIFASGLYVDVDTHTSRAVVFIRQE